MNQRKILAIGILYGILLMMFFQLPIYAFAQDNYDHEGDEETPVYIDTLEGFQGTWKFINVSGVFYEDYESNDLIRYEVQEANTQENSYDVEASLKSWNEDKFSDLDVPNSSYFITPREWGMIPHNIFLEQHSSYWGSKELINREYEVVYETEWWDWKMLNTVTIKYTMNKSNYDIIKYSRAEGVLLYRKAAVDAADGKYKGYLYIELVEYSGWLELSPWFYVIVIGTIVGIIAVIIITISLLIQRRKRIYREIDEI